jgi:hypothetical protein
MGIDRAVYHDSTPRLIFQESVAAETRLRDGQAGGRMIRKKSALVITV